MATDIFQLLVDILKISPQLVNEYAVQGPLYQIFYLFFFPALFIIVFIFILSRIVMPEHKGLRLLIALAVYAFIILQGYYNFFVYISEFWLIILIILGFIWFIIGRRGGEGVRGKVLGGKGSLFKLRQAIENKLGFSLNPLTNIEAVTDIKRSIEETNKKMEKVKALFDKEGNAEKKQFLLDQLGRLEQELAQLLYYQKHPVRRRKV